MHMGVGDGGGMLKRQPTSKQRVFSLRISSAPIQFPDCGPQSYIWPLTLTLLQVRGPAQVPSNLLSPRSVGTEHP